MLAVPDIFADILEFLFFASCISGIIISAFVSSEPSLSPTSNGLILLFMFPLTCFVMCCSITVMMIPFLILVLETSIEFPSIILGIVLSVAFIMAFLPVSAARYESSPYPLFVIFTFPIVWISAFLDLLLSPITLLSWVFKLVMGFVI